MTQQFVHTYNEDGIMRITIDRQDKLNALNRAVLEQLSEAFANAADDDAIRVVIITGAGPRAFVAGADIGEIRGLDPEHSRPFTEFGQNLMLRIQHLGKPVIAAVNGFALGGGCELALSCTLRIASSNAMMGLPEIKLGIMPGFGGTQRLARLIGRGTAMEMALTGNPVNAEQAASLGMVNLVVEPEALEETVDQLAHQLAHSAPRAMENIMKAINIGVDLSLEQGIELETDLFTELCKTQDMLEGTSAFLEKRKPAFTGQ